jgi:hypothetical protein
MNRKNPRWALPALLALGASASIACNRASGEPLPKAHWRLAAPSELDHVVLFVSHILVRHENTEAATVPFNVGDWTRVAPRSGRTTAQARERARSIADEARVAPDRFADLARARSDDEVTRDHGGSLGGVRATDLSPWPQVLDALAATRPGGISRVVETRFGFHVFRRNPVPAAQQIAGRRLVIGYDAASWLDVVRRPDRTKTTRTRADAWALARDLARASRAAPGAIRPLIERHSEHRDAVQGGDLGVWSNHEPTHLTREIEVLSRLEVGQVSDPVDSRVGVEVLQRTEADDRKQYAMSAIRIRFEPDVPNTHGLSRETIAQAALSLARRVADDASAFEQAQRQLCCIKPERWTAGRAPFGLTEVLERMATGEIARTPVESDYSLVIVKRLDPATLPPRPTITFDLPNPNAPDLTYFFRTRKGEQLASMVRTLAEKSRTNLGLSAARARELARIHEDLAATLAKAEDGEARVARYQQATANLQQLLGSDEFGRYRALVDGHVEAAILSALN